MSFKNLSITTKIGVIFGVVLIISIVNVSYIYFSKNKNSGTLIDVAGRNRMLSQRLAFYSSISQQPDDTCFSTIKQLCDLHDQSITVMKKGGIAPGIDNNKIVESIETIFPSEFKKIDQVWTPFRNSVNKLISSNSREEIENEKKQIINLANPLLEANNDLVISIVQWNKATESHINKILTILTVLNLLTIIIAFFILSNYVVKPLRKILPAFMDIANGIIGQKFKSGNKDEVGLLIDAFNKMNDNLENIIKEITVGADQIVTGSEQISQASQVLSTGAQQQAASTEEVSAAIEEMVASIEQNTENSLQTNSISNNAMQGMRDMVKSSQESMNAIRTITDKIKIINEIAFQTNMLALNAAVEAARAGEHGKGFAVVAAEVRKLAERSKNAANEIGEISSNSIQTIEKTKDIAMTLLPQVEKTAILVQEIAAAGKEQTSGASQINLAVQQMSHVIEQNAASSEELATSSEEFASQAEMLKETISFFRIVDENHNINRELITWGPKYCIGINTIDEQHKVLVDLINKLYVSFGEDGLKKQQKKIISELVNYTVFHFGNEEKMLEKIGYKELPSHKVSHVKFIEKIKTFEKDIKEGNAAVSFDIINFLKDWLIKHILHIDRKYVNEMKKHGIK